MTEIDRECRHHVEATRGEARIPGRVEHEIRAVDPEFSPRRWLESYPMTDRGQKTKLLQALDPLSL